MNNLYDILRKLRPVILPEHSRSPQQDNNATINQATDAKLNQAIDSHEDQHNTPQKKAYPAWR